VPIRLAARRLASTTQVRRGAVFTVALAVATGFAVSAGTAGAGAAPAPTVDQVQAEVNSLQAKVDTVGEQYDAANQQMAAAKARLTQVSKQAAHVQTQYDSARAQLAAVAVAAYENSNQSSILGLLSSNDPSEVLSQASIVTEVAGTNNEEANQFLTSAQDFASMREQQQHTEEGVAQIRQQLVAQKSSLTKLIATKQAALDGLSAQQQATVAASAIGGPGTGNATTTPIAYAGSTSTQAGQAVAFVYAQLGKPYLWGATGPSSFDCSGLVQAAWATAGVSIPRTTYEQWSALPHIPVSDMQPGDLLLYSGESHVAMYVGNGEIVDAPETGRDVELIPESTAWYADNLDGIIRP